jgi:F-type H+-transporting ATPase subunit delta
MRPFARPYAQAAIAVAGSLEKSALVRDQLAQLAGVVAGNPRLAAAIANPALPVDVKQKVADQIGEQMGLDVLTRRLAGALIQRHRLGRLDEVVAALTDELNRRQGIAVADVVTAEPLGDDERGELQKVLESKVGKKLQLRTRVEPGLIAGFVAQVDSQLFDGSLRGQLDRLAKELAQA